MTAEGCCEGHAPAGAGASRSSARYQGPLTATTGNRPVPVSLDRVDAHELDAEVAQAVEQPVQLRLVGEGARERALARVRLEHELLEGARDALAHVAAD